VLRYISNEAVLNFCSDKEFKVQYLSKDGREFSNVLEVVCIRATLESVRDVHFRRGTIRRLSTIAILFQHMLPVSPRSRKNSGIIQVIYKTCRLSAFITMYINGSDSTLYSAAHVKASAEWQERVAVNSGYFLLPFPGFCFWNCGLLVLLISSLPLLFGSVALKVVYI
jgi:hypothetical protein